VKKKAVVAVTTQIMSSRDFQTILAGPLSNEQAKAVMSAQKKYKVAVAFAAVAGALVLLGVGAIVVQVGINRRRATGYAGAGI
jgi:hypothetical protein